MCGLFIAGHLQRVHKIVLPGLKNLFKSCCETYSAYLKRSNYVVHNLLQEKKILTIPRVKGCNCDFELRFRAAKPKGL